MPRPLRRLGPHGHALVRPHFNRPSSAAATVQLVIWYKHVLERLRKKKLSQKGKH